MKTRRAFVLPVMLVTLIAGRSELRAQTLAAPPAAGAIPQAPYGAPVMVPPTTSQSQVPLGIPSTLGLQGPQGGVSGPAYGYAPVPVGPAGYAPPGAVAPAAMGDMFPAAAFASQPMPPGVMPPGMVGPGMMPPGMMGPGGVIPAGFEAAGYGPSPEMAVCPYCGGAGCEYCMGGGDSFGDRAERGFDLLKRLGPYPAGGWCSPRWFDVAVDFMYLKREDTGRRVDFMSDGPRGLGDPFIVLSSDNLNFDEAAGFRFAAALQVGASSSLEFVYFGTFNWSSNAFVTSPTDDLYSVFSDYGNNPPPQSTPTIVRGGFTDTDSAQFGSLAYSSNFDTLELDFRRRWMAPNCRIQGSWLMGVRYFRLEEQMVHTTDVNYPDPNDPGVQPDITGSMNYAAGTGNSLTGFQIGGDLWATLFPGVQVGSDLRAGIYGNHANQVTIIVADSLTSPIVERASRNSAAFLAEANLMGNWRINQHLTFRGGYTFLYVDSVALAVENFNSSPPFIVGARSPRINDNGDVFYHGFTAGMEWLW